MFADPNRLYLGGETYNDDAVIHFVDGDEDATTPDEEVDPDNWTALWSIDATADSLAFRDEQSGEAMLTLAPDGATFGEGMALGGDITEVNVVDDMIRFSGFQNVFEFRRSESDWDQMLEFHRQSNSDYEMYLHRGGDPHEVLTADHAVDASTLGGNGPEEFLLGGFDVLNDGSLVSDSVYEVDFGTDLGVSVTTDGVTVDYVGATIPSVVYDNGIEVLADANGIDFKSNLTATAGDNDVAEISLDLAGNLAETDAAETVTAQWSFDQPILGTADHANTADTAAFAEDIDSTLLDGYLQDSDSALLTSTWTFDDGLDVPSGGEIGIGDGTPYRLRHSAATDILVAEADVNGAATVISQTDRSAQTVNYNFTLQQDGNAVATQSWVETDADVLGTDQENTFTATQHFDAGVDASGGDYIAFPVHNSAPDHSNWPDGAGWFRSDLA